MGITIDKIKDRFENSIGEKIIITVEAGRGRIITHKGKLTEVYPAVFIVELKNSEDSYDCVSFNYTDVLTESIEVDFPDKETNVVFEE